MPTLPNLYSVEEAFIGTLLAKPELFGTIADSVTPEYLYNPGLAAIYKGFIELKSSGKPIDVVLLDARVAKHNDYQKLGGLSFLEAIKEKNTSNENILHYKDELERVFLDRKRILAFSKLQLAYLENKPDKDKTVANVKKELFDLEYRLSSNTITQVSSFSDDMLLTMHELSNSINKYTGIPSGITQLDDMTLGFQNKDLIFLAARTSNGKTAFAISVIADLIRKGADKVVCLFSLEMSREQLKNRLISILGYIPLQSIRSGRMNTYEWARYYYAQSEIDKYPLYILDKSDVNTLDIKNSIETVAMKEGRVDLVFVDYIQLMSGIGKSESRVQEVSKISREMKRIPMELNIPMIALSQLSRASELRTNHKPQLSDLRESGSQEMDADVVIFIYRDHVYNPTPDNENLAELIVAKQRNGPTGSVHAAFIKQFTAFRNLTIQ